jgi:PKD repeat protein
MPENTQTACRFRPYRPCPCGSCRPEHRVSKPAVRGWLYRILSLVALALPWSATPAAAQTTTTGAALWTEYAADPEDHSHVPNASFAGYMRGEAPLPEVPVVVDIRSFGGAGDGVTLNDKAIRDAIEAAWRQGGGAVWFPAGEFLIERMILLHRDGVVLRGAGPGQTVLRFTAPLISALGSTGSGTQEWNWTGGLLWIGARDTFRLNAYNSPYLRWNWQTRDVAPVEHDEDPNVNWGGSWENWRTLGAAGVIAELTSTHARGAWTVTVDDASALWPGELVMMSWVNPRGDNALWHEIAQHSSFAGTTLFDGWLSTAVPYFAWPVEIADVQGDQVTLAQPTRLSILPEYGVTFKRMGPHAQADVSYGGRFQASGPVVEKAGVEDMTLLMDNTRETYSYNNGDGWNGLFFNRAYNCWARNVEILNAETPVNVSSAKNISIVDVSIFSPYQSKYISTNRVLSHDVLYDGFSVTNTGLLSNGINTEWLSSGNVWTRMDLQKGTFDSHRMMSFDFLRTDIVLDNPDESRPGGAGDAGPFTGRRAVHWNVTVRDSDRPAAERGLWVYDPEQYTFGAQIGIQGAAPVYRSDTSSPSIWAMPSGDKAMLIGDADALPQPANLYDAQLAHRLGAAQSVVLNTPAHNFYSTTRPVVLRAAGHPGDGVSIERIRYYRGAGLLGEATAAPFAFTWEEPVPGRHWIFAEMVDGNGESTWSRPCDVVVGRRELLEHDDPRITYSGSWSVRTLAPTADGDPFFTSDRARYTAQDGAYAEVTFRGTRFTGYDSQVAEVRLNGLPMATVGFQRVANRAYHATVWDSGELPDGIHTVRISRTTGTLHVDHFIIDYTDGDLSVPIPYAFFAVDPESGLAPLQVTVDASLSSGNGYPIDSYEWDFGDGTVVVGPQAVRSHTYTGDGEHEITLTVVSSGGTFASHTATVFVGNRPPVARLAHEPVSGLPPLLFGFDASGSSDPDGSIVRYDWDFGDGTLLADGAAIASHTYTDYGEYTATVTVHDDYGDTASATVTVTVSLEPVVFARINFQPSSTTAPDGWLADSGALFGNRGDGFSYGWLSTPGATRQRNATNSPDLLHDTLIHTNGAVWEMELPDGDYEIRIVSGDPGYFDSVYRTTAEGVTVVDGIPTTTERWIEGIARISVADGRLTVADGGGASNNKLCFMEVFSIPETLDPDAYAEWVVANNITGGPDDLTGGIANLLRYAFGGDAGTPLAELLPQLQTSATGEGLILTVSFNRIDDPLVRYAVWTSTDLADWGAAPAWEQYGLGPGSVELQFPGAGRAFLRLEVTRE